MKSSFLSFAVDMMETKPPAVCAFLSSSTVSLSSKPGTSRVAQQPLEQAAGSASSVLSWFSQWREFNRAENKT